MKATFSLVLFSLFSINTFSQWDVVNESDCAYNAVFFLNDSVGFVVGICGGNNITIKKTIDYGESWYIVHDTTNAWIYDIYFPSDSIGYASTYENVLKTTDGGETWFYPTPEFEGYPYRSIVFQNDSIGFGCFTDNGAAFARTEDGGFTWTEEYEYGGREIIKVGDCQYRMVDGYYHKSDNCWEGHESIPLPIDDRYDENIAFSSDNIVLSCGLGYSSKTSSNFGFIGRSLNDGEDWSVIDFEYIYALRSIEFASNQIAYCVGQPYSPNPYSFLKTIDGGETWFYQEYELVCETCFSPDIRDVYCASENVCYAVSGGGGIWRTLNGGGELYPLPTNVSEFETNKVSISPNPASNSVTISSDNELNEIQLYNAFGQLVQEAKVSGKTKNINISALEQGIYIVRITSEHGFSNHRIVKQ
jgi:photosystem II stability/assembly factor-like uncharacterized protein